MLLRQICFDNNLQTHRENTDFPWEKPWKLRSAEENFEDCD